MSFVFRKNESRQSYYFSAVLCVVLGKFHDALDQKAAAPVEEPLRVELPQLRVVVVPDIRLVGQKAKGTGGLAAQQGTHLLPPVGLQFVVVQIGDRKSTRLNSSH